MNEELFKKMPIVGIIRNLSFDDVQHIIPVYIEAGLSNIEVTMNTTGAADMIRYILRQYPEQLNVGAGTVCNLEDLEKALSAGAQFIVTPIVREEVITACVQRKIPVFPGAFTPTEIYHAWSLGATMVKVFPSSVLGSAYIKDIKGPLNQIRLLPTGGVDHANIGDFLKAGAEGFGIGSPLFNKKYIDAKDWEQLKAHFSLFVNAVKEANA
jgi:2-dehydro-3-deoxyphosphogluconate aldolase/(4S)-4-hydroxy-2-oxoglutarate aldolase